MTNLTCSFDERIERRRTNCLKWDALRDAFGQEDLLPLWVADMDFPSPPAVIEVLQEKAAHRVYGYHVRSESFFESVVEWFGRRHGWAIEREWIALTPGVVPSICLAIQAFTAPGDGVVIQSPVYPPFFRCVNENGRRLVENPLRQVDGCYEIDFDDLAAKLDDGVRMLVLCSPHNPVGRVWTEAELRRINELCRERDIIVLSDEIHCDLVFRGHRHIPFAALGADAAARTVTCVAPSKTFNIAGLNTSFVIISDGGLRRRFRKHMAALSLGEGNLFGVAASEAAYRHGDAWLDALLPYLEDNADYFVRYVRERLPELQVVKPEGTYLGWLDCRSLGLAPAELKRFFVEKAKVGLNDGLTFGRPGAGFARINFGCPQAVLAEGMQRIEAALRSR
ncbi:putative C-S lyase [Heliobacterium undosum]|uniref:cysteine-S-conjugate beta-lyase n=1 Tax=Heliomicrobium undosum TaxID=121734 RepID=A0A845L299_9FIRM|nr:PatB family C-S lyase [Heliomicrobium undosum]MZP30677.1 putative C-S lyase [Heliomicrobium undosum]